NNSATLAVVGRALISVIFIMSGFGKLMAPAGAEGYIAAAGLPLPGLAVWIAVIVELCGGILLLVGYQTRIVAAALALFTVAAALGSHHDCGDQNQFIHFMKNIAMAGGLLQVVAYGAGAYSLDERASVRGGHAAAAR